VHPIATVIALLIVVFAHMVFGEMVPKSITLSQPEATLRVLRVENLRCRGHSRTTTQELATAPLPVELPLALALSSMLPPALLEAMAVF
jgi:hypothetical protein